MAIRRPSTHVLEYGDTIIPVTVSDGRVIFSAEEMDGTPQDICIPAAHWPAFENDIRELLGIPKHRPSRAKAKKQD